MSEVLLEEFGPDQEELTHDDSNSDHLGKSPPSMLGSFAELNLLNLINDK